MTADPAPDETCTYCLGSVPAAECTWDHVIAESWYSTAAGGVERWQVPACRTCNHEFGKVERDALVRFAACLDGDNPAYEQIVERAKRAMDANQGNNERDARSREAMFRRIKADLAEVPEVDAEGVLPFFRQNFAAGVRHVVRIPQESLEAIARKWARGLYRLHYGELLPADAKIDVHYLTEEGEREVFGELLPYLDALDRGPDVQVLLVRAKEEGSEAYMVSFRIWQEYRVHCAYTAGAEAAS